MNEKVAAFPLATGTVDNGGNPTQPGMSLHDWFAGMALMGLIAQAGPPAYDKTSREDFAAMAYKYADAMLEARENECVTTTARARGVAQPLREMRIGDWEPR